MDPRTRRVRDLLQASLDARAEELQRLKDAAAAMAASIAAAGHSDDHHAPMQALQKVVDDMQQSAADDKAGLDDYQATLDDLMKEGLSRFTVTSGSWLDCISSKGGTTRARMFTGYDSARELFV
jgi:hypothetical protein